MIELTEEYKAAAKEYRKTVGYGVPLSMIPPVVETSELIRQIKVCVEDKKDTLLQFFDVEINEGELM